MAVDQLQIVIHVSRESFFVKDKTLNIAHVNVQGLSNKLIGVEVFLQQYNVDVLGLTEHWFLNQDFQNIQFVGYNIVSCFSRTTTTHGGSMLLVRNKYDVSEMPYFGSLSVECHVEICGLALKCFRTNIIILCIYRPCGGDVNIFIDNVTAALTYAFSFKGSHIILTGDFNINSLIKNLQFNLMSDLLNAFDLSCFCPDIPTRVFKYRNGATSVSCIDYMISNIHNDGDLCSVVNPLLGDHLGHVLSLTGLLVSKSANRVSEVKCRVRMTKPANLLQLERGLDTVDWSFVCNRDLEDGFALFYESLRWFFDLCCPFVTVRRKPMTEVWLSKELKEELGSLRDLFWLVSVLDTQQSWEQYMSAKKSLRSRMEAEKLKFYSAKIYGAKNRAKETWKIVNQSTGKNTQKKKIINKLVIDGKVVTSPGDVSQAFAGYFTSAASSALLHHFGCNVSLPPTTSLNNPSSIFITPILEEEIVSVVTGLRNKSSCGVDGISSNVLKSVIESLKSPLAILFNRSLESGTFPTCLKTAMVTPIYKKGLQENVDNYRQISVLNSLSIAFERLVYDKIMNFLNKCNVISNCQHGFRTGKSVETASFQLFDFIYERLDHGDYVVSLFFDLSKAFDTVDVNILAIKLESVGIRGVLLNWIRSYMSGRRLVVRVGDVQSDSGLVHLGVPQGSVLGPLLFVLYVNDLPRHIDGGMITMFADDTTIAVSSPSLVELQLKVTRTVESFTCWCERNKLILNLDKTVFVNFYNRKPISNSVFSCGGVKLCNESKFLGTYLDGSLSWQSHIENVSGRLNSAFYAILVLKSSLTQPVLLEIYYALAYSHIAYNILLWGATSEIQRIFVGQKRILRLIFNLERLETCKEIFRKNNILTVPCVYIYKCLLFVRENFHCFEKTSHGHAYATRHGALSLAYPKHKTTLFERSPRYMCVKIFNSLPQGLKLMHNKNNFKINVKKYLINKAFYSVRDFMSETA